MARIGITEAARRLGVSVDTVRRRVRKGELTAIRDNRGMWQVELPDNAPPPCIGRNNVALPYAVPMQDDPVPPDPALLAVLETALERERARVDAAELRADRAEARADRAEQWAETDRAAAAEREAQLRSQVETLTATTAQGAPLTWRDLVQWIRPTKGRE